MTNFGTGAGAWGRTAGSTAFAGAMGVSSSSPIGDGGALTEEALTDSSVSKMRISSRGYVSSEVLQTWNGECDCNGQHHKLSFKENMVRALPRQSLSCL